MTSVIFKTFYKIRTTFILNKNLKNIKASDKYLMYNKVIPYKIIKV